jgi:hypothetical protein
MKPIEEADIESSLAKERQPGEIGPVEGKIDKYKWKTSKRQAG